ncbi:MAG: hypothetical protein II793_04330 [Bacteroidales bacterium]|nr:hypothetical protein [Bacteroidales bacterium]
MANLFIVGSAGAVRPNLMRHHEITVQHLRLGIGAMAFEGGSGWLLSSNSWSAGVGAYYTYWFTRHIGISAGGSVSYLSHSERLDDISSSSRGTVSISNGTTSVPYSATMSVATSEVRENQSFTMLEIPLQLSLKANHLYANVGMSFATSLSAYGAYVYSSSTYKVTEIEDLGVSLDGVPLSSSVAEGGSGDYSPSSVKRPIFAMVSAEVGWRFNFDQCNMVSLSLYGSYALNRCSPDVAASEIVDVENGVARRLSPMQAGLVDGYRYYTAGFCIAYHLGVGSPLLK